MLKCFYSIYQIKTMRIGTIAGFILTAASIPFIASSSEADKKEKANTTSLITEQDKKEIEMLMSRPGFQDLRLQETKWVEKVYPTIRTKLINLYKAEIEDNELIREGKIKEKDRKVKIAITDFADPGDHGDDMGLGGHIHFVKYYDEKQPDSSYTRTYINEHRPVLETGGILPPKSIRIRTQVFNGSLAEKGAEKLLIPDVIEVVWGKSKDSPKTFYPYFYRQHWYNEFDPKSKSNPIANTEFFLSSPTSCINCHISNSDITAKTFLKKGEKRTNFGAITPDSEFEKPIGEQRGFKILKRHLDEMIKHKKITEERKDTILKDLQYPTIFENPNIVTALESKENLPWIQEDEELKKGEQVPEIYKYEWGNKLWKTGGYLHHRNQGLLEGLGQRWSIIDLQVIPKKRER